MEQKINKVFDANDFKIMAEQKHTYMLLDRLRSDCEYYLHFGCRSNLSLWAKDEHEQIAKMKELYNSLVIKPLWLTMNDIYTYEFKMIERKPGEIFSYNNIKFITKISKSNSCEYCCFINTSLCELINTNKYTLCKSVERLDKKDIIFKPYRIIDRIKYFIKTRIFKTN